MTLYRGDRFRSTHISEYPQMPNATVGADAPASPKSAIDHEYLRLSAEKIVADVRFEAAEERLAEAIKKKKAEDAAEAEEPKRRASQELHVGIWAFTDGQHDPEEQLENE
jgi:hypothetical protein